jgi:hypothetical protein
VTIHKTRDIYIRRRRVSLAEFYCSIYEDFHVAYINETGASSIEAAPTCGGVEVSGIAVLPVLVVRKVCWVSNKTAKAPRFQICDLGTISTSQHNGRGPDSYLKRLWIFVWMRVYMV